MAARTPLSLGRLGSGHRRHRMNLANEWAKERMIYSLAGSHSLIWIKLQQRAQERHELLVWNALFHRLGMPDCLERRRRGMFGPAQSRPVISEFNHSICSHFIIVVILAVLAAMERTTPTVAATAGVLAGHLHHGFLPLPFQTLGLADSSELLGRQQHLCRYLATHYFL